MNSMHRRVSARHLGVSLLALAVVVLWGSTLRIPVAASRLPDLLPGPDGGEYLGGAVSLAREGDFEIYVAGRPFPPRYPFGYSAAMVPLLLLGVEPIAAPFWTNRLLGLLLIGSLFAMLWSRRQHVAAGLAALLLATFPAFLILARSPMSEVSSAVMILLAYFLLFRAVSDRAPALALVGALLLGLSVCIRISNVFFGAILLLAPVAIVATRRRRLKLALLLVALFVVGITPLFWYQMVTFGHPLRTGYGFWVPYFAKLSNAFHWYYLEPNLLYYWHEISESEREYTVASLLGQGSYFSPFLILAGAVAAFNVPWRRPALLICALSVAVATVPFLFYFHRDGRLLFSHGMLAIPLVAVGMARQFRRAGPWQRLFLAALLSACILQYPASRFQADLPKYLQGIPIAGESVSYGLVSELKKLKGSQSVLILTDLQPPVVYAMTLGERIVSPFKNAHHYIHNPAVFSYGDQERFEQIAEAVKRGWGVYALSSTVAIHDLVGQLPAPPGWIWKVRWENRWRGGIAVLTHATHSAG